MEIRDGKYLLKLAETPAEKDEIYALRHNIYCKELNFACKKNGNQTDSLIERDSFDELCDHLLIRDESQNRCVGTFRFLPGARLSQGGTFYSEQWFDIGVLRNDRNIILELGRACIDAQYRNSRVFRLLFSGLGAYLQLYPHTYLIGLTTLIPAAKDDIIMISQYLSGTDTGNISFGIKPFQQLDTASSQPDQRPLAELRQQDIINKMSTLMYAYYKYGAKFISEPSIDTDFNPPVYDYFTIFDTKKIPTWVSSKSQAS